MTRFPSVNRPRRPGAKTRRAGIPDLWSSREGRVKKRRGLRGQAVDLMTWEPGLRALYNGRALYDPERVDLTDRRGRALDVGRTFLVSDDREDMAHFLRTAGYLFVRDVFRADDIVAFRED